MPERPYILVKYAPNEGDKWYREMQPYFGDPAACIERALPKLQSIDAEIRKRAALLVINSVDGLNEPAKAADALAVAYKNLPEVTQPYAVQMWRCFADQICDEKKLDQSLQFAWKNAPEKTPLALAATRKLLRSAPNELPMVRA